MAEQSTKKEISEAMIVITKTTDLVDLLTAVQVLIRQLLSGEKTQPETTVFVYVMDRILTEALDLVVDDVFAPNDDSQMSLFGEVPFVKKESR